MINWEAKQLAEGYATFTITHKNVSRTFAINDKLIKMFVTPNKESIVHEAYRSLLTNMKTGWIPDHRYYNQLEAIFAPIANYSDRWYATQVEAVTIFTDIHALKPCLEKFFTLVDSPDLAGVSLVSCNYKIPEDPIKSFGKVLRILLSDRGSIQIWDDALKFNVSSNGPMVIPNELFSYTLGMLLVNHIVNFRFEKSFVDIHPITLNATHMFFDKA